MIKLCGVIIVSEESAKKEKRMIKMAVMTAKCDRTFVVSADNAKVFREQKKDENAFTKINLAASKLEKRLKIDDGQRNK